MTARATWQSTNLSWLGLAGLLGLSTFASAQAETVTLSVNHGDSVITGELLDFANGTYHVRASIGILEIDASVVTCAGPGCPEPAVAGNLLRLAADPALDTLLDDYLREFADARGYSVISGPDTEIAGFSVSGGEDLDVVLGTAAADDGIRISITDRYTKNSTIIGRDAIVLYGANGAIGSTIPMAEARALLSGRNTSRFVPEMPQPGTFAAISLASIGTGELDPNDATAALGAVPETVRIGLFSQAAAEGYHPLSLAADCGPPLTANPISIAAGTYPYSVAVRATPPESPSAAEDAFLSFLAARRDSAGNGTTGDMAYLPLDQQGEYLAHAIRSAQTTGDLNGLAALTADLAGAELLTMTSGFASSTARPSSMASQTIRNLASHIDQVAMDGRELLVLGFSDSLERGGRRAGLSRNRAEAVKRLIVDAAATDADWIPRIRTLGYEDLAPRGCNDTVSGRGANRRVEIWLRDIR